MKRGELVHTHNIASDWGLGLCKACQLRCAVCKGENGILYPFGWLAHSLNWDSDYAHISCAVRILKRQYGKGK